MNKEREIWLCSLSNNEKMNLEYRDFIKDEVIEIMNQLLINDDLRREAELYYVKCYTIQQVADTMQIDIKTAKNHRKKLSYAMKRTLCKMYPYSPRD